MTIFNSYFDITRGYHWWLSSPTIGQPSVLSGFQLTLRVAHGRIGGLGIAASFRPLEDLSHQLEMWFLLISCDQREELKTVGVWLQIHPYMNVNRLRCLWHVESCRMEGTYPVNRWSPSKKLGHVGSTCLTVWPFTNWPCSKKCAERGWDHSVVSKERFPSWRNGTTFTIHFTVVFCAL